MTLREQVRQRLTRDDFAYSDEFLDAVVGVVLGVVATQIEAMRWADPPSSSARVWNGALDDVLEMVRGMGGGK